MAARVADAAFSIKRANAKQNKRNPISNRAEKWLRISERRRIWPE